MRCLIVAWMRVSGFHDLHVAHGRLDLEQSKRKQEFRGFRYLTIRQINSTTAAPAAAAISDVISPPPSASRAM